MRNEKSGLYILIGFLALLVAGVVFFSVLRGGFHPSLSSSSTISSDQLLAEADKYQIDKYQTGNGLPVKVTGGSEASLTPVIVSRLDSNDLVKSYATCATKPPAPTAPQVVCWVGRQLATQKQKYISDASTSIQEIDKMLSSIKDLMDNDLNKRTSIDGLSLYVIPGGRDTQPSFTVAENIEMKCLGDKSEPNTPGAITAIGRQGSNPSILFNNAPSDLIEELRKMKKDNAKTNAEIEPKLASDSTKLTAGENISLGNTAVGLHTALSGKHIGVTQAMLNKHYRTLVDAKVPLFFQAYLARDKNGNPINCTADVPWGVKFALKPLKLSGPFFRVNLKIDELGYTKVCVPDASLLALIKQDMQAHIDRLQKLRAGHETRRKNWEKELADAKARNYSCP